MVKNTFLKLPNNNLVENFYKNLNLSKLDYYKNICCIKYLDTNKELNDFELSRIITYDINWEQFSYQHKLYYLQNIDNSAHPIITDLYNAYKNITFVKEFIDKYFLNIDQLSGIELLSWSLFNNSKVLYIPKKFRSQEDIILDNIFKSDNLLVNNILIIAESETSVNINIKHQNSGITINNIIGYLASNSNIKIVVDKDYNNFVINNESWILEKNSILEIFETITCLIGLEFKQIKLIGDHAAANLKVLSGLNFKDNLAIITNQQHLACGTKSNLTVKSVLESESRLFYRGNINIEMYAIKSEADQQQQSLLLGDNVQNCAIPALEIKTDDVQCRHGSASSNISKDHLWFLQSRGLDYLQAKNMVVLGFIDEYANISNLNLNIVKKRIAS